MNSHPTHFEFFKYVEKSCVDSAAAEVILSIMQTINPLLVISRSVMQGAEV